jgi:Fe-S oxidoreductase
LAESFTAGIAGGSFLTKPMYWLFNNFLTNNDHILPTWWAYSIALGLFFIALPFSRYMHIPTEALLILFRNAGLKVTRPRKGFAEAEIYSCSSCGLCIDACPMNAQKKNLKYSSVYFIRFLRRHNTKKINEIANKCLMCGKCVELCPVGINSCAIKQAQRGTVTNNIKHNYTYLNNIEYAKQPKEEKILYFAGCMTHLTPSISNNLESILAKAKCNYVFADKDGGICCGRPLKLSGREEAAKELIAKNTQMILESGCSTLLLSCPICLKVFKEDYNLKGIKILHHTQFINNLLKERRIEVSKNMQSVVYHHPCDLGRGCGIYNEPLNILEQISEIKHAEKEGKESICCGGSLGSLTLNYADRVKITQSSLQALTINNPDKIVTACPLCLKTFSDQSKTSVEDIAQIVNENIKHN